MVAALFLSLSLSSHTKKHPSTFEKLLKSKVSSMRRVPQLSLSLFDIDALSISEERTRWAVVFWIREKDKNVSLFQTDMPTNR